MYRNGMEFNRQRIIESARDQADIKPAPTVIECDDLLKGMFKLATHTQPQQAGAA